LKTLWKNNTLFYFAFALFAVAGICIIFNTDKFELHLAINSIVGNPFLNNFFKYITFVGDGLFLVIVAVVLLFFNVKNSLFLLLSYALSGGTTQLLKAFAFRDVDRPYLFYSFYDFKFTLVEGVDMASNRSFPSGHSTSALCLFFCLSFLSRHKGLQLLFFVLGIITAFSRVYLSQHFFEDIYAGSMIGVVLSSLVAWFLYISAFDKKTLRLQRPVYKLFSKQNG
jgi:membrane-associated phospholipid phosphatase